MSVLGKSPILHKESVLASWEAYNMIMVASGPKPSVHDTSMHVELTPRHKQVVRLLSLGCTVKETAKILKISPSTVDNHKTAAMARLGTDKLALLTRLAVKLKISNLGDRLTPREKRLSGRKNDGWN
jgi:DNA-binding NarL/FixJ family response regulator